METQKPTPPSPARPTPPPSKPPVKEVAQPNPDVARLENMKVLNRLEEAKLDLANRAREQKLATKIDPPPASTKKLYSGLMKLSSTSFVDGKEVFVTTTVAEPHTQEGLFYILKNNQPTASAEDFKFEELQPKLEEAKKGA